MFGQKVEYVSLDFFFQIVLAASSRRQERLVSLLNAETYWTDAPSRHSAQCGLDKFQYLLTPWRRVLLEKLAGFQIVKKFHAF